MINYTEWGVINLNLRPLSHLCTLDNKGFNKSFSNPSVGLLKRMLMLLRIKDLRKPSHWSNMRIHKRVNLLAAEESQSWTLGWPQQLGPTSTLSYPICQRWPSTCVRSTNANLTSKNQSKHCLHYVKRSKRTNTILIFRMCIPWMRWKKHLEICSITRTNLQFKWLIVLCATKKIFNNMWRTGIW